MRVIIIVVLVAIISSSSAFEFRQKAIDFKPCTGYLLYDFHKSVNCFLIGKISGRQCTRCDEKGQTECVECPPLFPKLQPTTAPTTVESSSTTEAAETTEAKVTAAKQSTSAPTTEAVVTREEQSTAGSTTLEAIVTSTSASETEKRTSDNEAASDKGISTISGVQTTNMEDQTPI